MDKTIFQDVPVNERKQLLEDNAHKVVPDYVYQKSFDSDEVQMLKHELSEDMIKKSAIDDEFKAIKETFKIRLKPINSRITESLQNIKHQSRQVEETVYEMTDFENDMILIYNAEGELLHSRRMIPAERQLKLNVVHRKASNE